MSKHEQIEVSMRTDQGRMRNHNQDFIIRWEPDTPEEEARHGRLYIVADGVGGADAGEIASEYASMRTRDHYLTDSDEPEWGQRLLKAMQAANTDLRQMVIERNDNSRMATTMVAAVIHEQTAYIANVGDSRGYHYRNGDFNQITKDQSLVAKLVEEGAITETEALNHPRKNVILYSIGSERTPKIDLFELSLETNDILVLCSDGLTRHVSDQEITEHISKQPPSKATESLIQLANERGGEDNISVAVMHYTAEAENALSTSQIDTSLGQRILGLYTIFLSLVMSILIILIWLLLRV